ncbi:sugar transferase [Zhihengliuella sp.]|uniref:sugar transferase n=1 Tax=Zhihengliuella sp. TaxID=1954483 RepID=UPI002811F5DE|nr:sugar transferase [Zhihengliuella sp.]
MVDGKTDWRQTLPRRLAVIDAVAVVSAISVAHLTRFGADASVPLFTRGDHIEFNYTTFGIVTGLAWIAALKIWNSRDIKILGAGSEEYKRVCASSLALFGAIAILSYALRIETARGYVGVALPLGLLLLLLGRWTFRRRLLYRRGQGHYTRRLLLVGHPGAVNHLANSLRLAPGAGYLPVGAAIPSSTEPESLASLSVPMLVSDHSVHSITHVIDSEGIDAVAISAGSDLQPTAVRQLGWELQAREVSLIMAPALTDVAGPRIHTQPIAGLPLIHVATPKLEGLQAASKRAFDLMSAAVGLLLLSPVFIAVALSIMSHDKGPAIFHQERVGKDGRTFRMYKFRSMVVDAEKRLDELSNLSEGNGVLFKLKADPRVTKIGAFIRRYSIDELPQLWNVLIGDMSLVGPRPPLPAEVAVYEEYVDRRLMVKPGITGLWQVSGRSDLSWDDSVRLDLYYVENWSLTQDLLILAKTAKAVIGKDGAY